MSSLFHHNDGHHHKDNHRETSIAWVETDKFKHFYRVAGKENAPVLLCVPGYPTSSFQYRHLLDKLSDKFRVIALDTPGFGFSQVKEGAKLEYTFDNLANAVEDFIDAIGLKAYGFWGFDYGMPVMMRVATSRPDSIKFIISQNGNVDVAGLGSFWDGLKDVWGNPSDENKQKIKWLMSPETIKWMYTKGEKHPETIPPEAYSLDDFLVSRPGQEDIQLGLFADYRHNVELYPKWQKWLEEYQPPLLAVWGKSDEIFIPPGAEAFKKYVKKAEVVLIEDAGHFVLENHANEVVGHVRAFAHKHNLY